MRLPFRFARSVASGLFALLLTARLVQAQAGTTGRVAEVANPVRLQMDAGAAAPIGATVYTYRAVPGGGAGVLSGTYTVVRQSGADVFAELSGEAAGGGPSVGQRAEVTGAAQPSLVRIESDPSGAAVTRGGYPLGTTPLRVEVVPGDHAFVLTAAGYDPTPLSVQVPEGQIVSYVQGLARPRPATDLYTEAEIAFQAARYDDAEALLTRAEQNTDASLTAAQTAGLPSLSFAAGLGSGIAARGAARGLTPAQIADALSKIVFVHKRRGEPEVVRGVLAALDATLAGDPALASVRALLGP